MLDFRLINCLLDVTSNAMHPFLHLDQLPMVNHSTVSQTIRIAATWDQHFQVI